MFAANENVKESDVVNVNVVQEEADIEDSGDDEMGSGDDEMQNDEMPDDEMPQTGETWTSCTLHIRLTLALLLHNLFAVGF